MECFAWTGFHLCRQYWVIVLLGMCTMWCCICILGSRGEMVLYSCVFSCVFALVSWKCFVCTHALRRSVGLMDDINLSCYSKGFGELVD